MTDLQPGDSDPVANPGGDGVVLSGREAAQGRSGLQIVIVLVVSLVLVIVVLFSLFGLHAHKGADTTPGGSATVAPNTTAGSTFNAPPADSPKQNPPPASAAAAQGS